VRNRIKTLFSFFLLVPLASAAFASQSLLALNYFHSAENFYAQGQYEQALEQYAKAISIQSDDGPVTTNVIKQFSLRSMGRGVRPYSSEKQIQQDYFPQQRMQEIIALLEEKRRLAHPPQLDITSISFKDPTSDQVFDGGERASFVLEILNSGQSVAKQVSIDIQHSAGNQVKVINDLYIGELQPKQRILKFIELEAERSIANQIVRFEFVAQEIAGFDSPPFSVSVTSKTHQAEQLVISKVEYYDYDADGKIGPGEIVNVNLTLSNIGKGVSDYLNAEIQLGENVFFGPDSFSHFVVGRLYPKQERTFSFSFLSNQRVKHNQQFPITLELRNPSNQIVFSDLLDLNAYLTQQDKHIVIEQITNDTTIGNYSSEKTFQFTNPPIDEHAIAVVIGNRNYTAVGVPRVSYAHNDARQIRLYLHKQLGFSQKNILFYEDASAATFYELFGTADNPRGKLNHLVTPGQTRLFIYYTGHGAPDLEDEENAFLVPVDSDPFYLRYSAYSLRLFYSNLTLLGAKDLTIVLDTCFSGNSAGGFLFSDISPIQLKSPNIHPLLKNTSIFTSTSASQISTWLKREKHSLFTYYFLLGLQGKADANNDRRITSVEINEYLQQHVTTQARKLYGVTQTPQLVQSSSQILVNLGKANLEHDFENSL